MAIGNCQQSSRPQVSFQAVQTWPQVVHLIQVEMNAHPARALLSAGDLMQEVRRHGVTGDELPVLSGLTVTVPGTAMAWEDTLKSFGRLPMAQVCPSCLVCLIALPHCGQLSKHMLIGQRMRCTHAMKSCLSRTSSPALLSSVHFAGF